VLGFTQIVSMLTVNLPSVPWPGALSGVWGALAIVNLDVFSALSVDCISSSYDFRDIFLTTVIAPAIVLMLIVAVTQCRKIGKTRVKQEEITIEGWKVTLLGAFIIYPMVSSTILKMWNCRNIEGTSYLVADYRVTCNDDSSWSMYAALAGVAFVAFPLGIPLFYLYLLLINKDALHDESHADHSNVYARLGFIYRQYEPQAWYWELLMLAHKLLLTGLIIFIKPGTTTQLIAGFAISITFFIWHVQTGAYKTDLEDELQFCAMLSITLTLFGGLSLKAQEGMEEAQLEDPSPAEKGVTAFMLVLINVGVVVLMLYQVFLTFRKPPAVTTVKLQRRICVKLFTAALDSNQEAFTAVCLHQGVPEEHIPTVEAALREVAGALPIALELLDDVSVLVEQLTSIGSITDAMSLVDGLLGIARSVLGPPRMVALFKPYCNMFAEQLVGHLKQHGASDAVLELAEKLVPGLAQFIVGNGMKPFMLQVMSLTKVNDMASLQAQLQNLNSQSLPALS